MPKIKWNYYKNIFTKGSNYIFLITYLTYASICSCYYEDKTKKKEYYGKTENSEVRYDLENIDSKFTKPLKIKQPSNREKGFLI